MRDVLRSAHAAIANLEHVGIVPLPGTGMRRQIALRESDIGHGVPGIANVAGGAPEIARYRGPPFLHFVAAVLAKAVNDRAAGRANCFAHLLVCSRLSSSFQMREALHQSYFK